MCASWSRGREFGPVLSFTGYGCARRGVADAVSGPLLEKVPFIFVTLVTLAVVLTVYGIASPFAPRSASPNIQNVCKSKLSIFANIAFGIKQGTHPIPCPLYVIEERAELGSLPTAVDRKGIEQGSTSMRGFGRAPLTALTRICHLSDFHSAVYHDTHKAASHFLSGADEPWAPSDLRALKPSCPRDLVSTIGVILAENCDPATSLRVFSGDFIKKHEPREEWEPWLKRAMKAWQLDIWVPGNHDVAGWDLLDFVANQISPADRPTILVSNAHVDRNTPKKERGSYFTRSVALSTTEDKKMKACMYGWVPQDMSPLLRGIQNRLPKDLIVDTDYLSATQAALAEADLACSDPSTFRILVSHAGFNDDVAFNAPQLDVDVILGGHSHTNFKGEYPFFIKQGQNLTNAKNVTALSHVGAHAKSLGIIQLETRNAHADAQTEAGAKVDADEEAQSRKAWKVSQDSKLVSIPDYTPKEQGRWPEICRTDLAT